MEKEKLEAITAALSGLSYKEFLEVTRRVDSLYHVTKKELTSDEISSQLKNIRS